MVDNTVNYRVKNCQSESRTMNKLSVILVLLFASIFASHALYSQQTDSEKRDLKLYKVKRATSLKYSYDSDGHESVPTKSSSEYDTNGNLAKRIEYGSDGTGKPVHEWTYKYDHNNGMIEFTLDGRLQETALYKYGGASQVVVATRFDPDHHVKERIMYSYDGSGKLMEKMLYDGRGQINSIDRVKYDPEGNESENDRFSADGSLAEKQKFRCNEKGHPIQTTLYDSAGHLSRKILYKHAKDGEHVVEESHLDSRGNLQTRSIYNRVSQGLVVEEMKYDSKGKLVERTEAEYEFHQ